MKTSLNSNTSQLGLELIFDASACSPYFSIILFASDLYGCL